MAGSAANAWDAPVTDEELRQLLLDTKVIAVVGLSANPDRPPNQVAEPVDLVDVFRRPEHTPDVARAAVAAGAGALWLQLGISSPEARAIAEEAGLRYVEDHCLKVEHARLLGRSPRSQTAS
jgi:predicted CoA-binding protein